MGSNDTSGSYQSAGATKKGFNLKATPSSVKADHTKMYNFQDPAVQEEAFQNK